MTALIQSFSNLPGTIKTFASALLGGTVVGYAALAFLQPQVMIFVTIGLVIVAGFLFGYRALLRWREKRKADPFTQALRESSAAVPQGTGAANRASLDNLRKKFDEAIGKFRAHGKNIYSLPWYVIVGEPGSGKTEAIRHCNLGFPPGLQNEQQGVGGTINMDWWFTNNAIILDTAGRLVFGDVESTATTEWQEFLRLLARHRKNCPINGLILAIPADSLIKDSADVIEGKAKRITEKLDQVQRVLGVRFPVFVIITKSDLINGFREFFDDIVDPQLQHQMFGWSNPAPLDEPFKAERVDAYVHQIRERLVKRRLTMLQDPVHTEDPGGRRLDQVDSLYDFPNQLPGLAPRLRRYLELIFVGGTWSAKPLFLRGIYFTSSLREGEELDKELAKLHGVPVESLPGGRAWSRDKAYFLRDLFLNKIFKERGLVTRAHNTQSLQRHRRAALLTASFAVLLVVAGLTVWGYFALNRSIQGPTNAWRAVAADYVADPDNDRRSLRSTTAAFQSRDISEYFGETELSDRRVIERPVDVQQLAEDKITPAFIFRVMSPQGNVLADKRQQAARVLFNHSVLSPLADTAGKRLAGETNWDDQAEAARALEQLLRLEVAASGLAPAQPVADGGSAVALQPLFKYAIERSEADPRFKGAAGGYLKVDPDVKKLQAAFDALYLTKSAAGANELDGKAADETITPHRREVDAALGKLRASFAGAGGIDATALAIKTALDELDSAERQLHVVDVNSASRAGDWQTRYATVQAKAEQVTVQLAALEASSLRGFVEQAHARQQARARELLVGLLAALPAQGSADPRAQEFAPIRASLATIQTNAAQPLDPKHLAELDALDAAHLARSSSASRQRCFEIRLAMYEHANQQLVLATPQPRLLELVEALRALESWSGRIQDLANSLPAAPAAAPGGGGEPALNVAAPRNAGAALAFAQLQRRQDLYALFLQEIAGGRLGGMIAEAARDAAGDAPQDSLSRQLDELPRVPLTRLAEETGFEVRDNFDPHGAREALVLWRAIDAHSRGGAAASASAPAEPAQVLDIAKLRSHHASARPELERYVREYAGEWGRVAQEAANPRIVEWKDVKTRLGPLREGDVNAALETVSALLEDAFALVRSEPGVTPPAIGARPKDAAFRFDQDCKAMLEAWEPAAGDAQRARTAVLASPRSNFRARYWPSPANIHERYWSNLTVSLVTALAYECNRGAAELARVLMERRLFPLAARVQTQTAAWKVPVLTREQFDDLQRRAADTRLTAMPAAPGANASDANPPLAADSDPLEEALSALENPGGVGPRELELLRVLAAVPARATMRFVTRAGDATNVYRYVVVESGDKIGAPLATTGARHEPIKLEFPAASDLELRYFKTLEDAQKNQPGLASIAHLPQPWTVLPGLWGQDVPPSEKRDVWLVPVTAGEAAHVFWIEVTLEPPLARPREDWPSPG